MRNKSIMLLPVVHYLAEANLSVAWSRAFLTLAARRTGEIVPLPREHYRLSTTGVPAEDDGVRKALDSCLEANGHQAAHTVANTIFPQSLWRRAKGDRQKLFDEYLENLPTYVDMAPTKNRCGLYFSRLIAFGVDPKTGGRLTEVPTHRQVSQT